MTKHWIPNHMIDKVTHHLKGSVGAKRSFPHVHISWGSKAVWRGKYPGRPGKILTITGPGADRARKALRACLRNKC